MTDMSQTGRTYRMLQYAKQEQDNGKNVTIYFSTWLVAKQFKQLIDKAKYPNITCAAIPPSFDWDNMKPHATNLDTLLLFDHWLIESRFSNALKELHRFDYPLSPELSLKYRDEVMKSYE